MFRREEAYWWEQLRHMLAQVCSILVNTAEGAAGDGKRYVLTGPAHKATAPLDFIPKRWLDTPPDTQPATSRVIHTKSGTKLRVLQGMAADDAQSFFAELGVGV